MGYDIPRRIGFLVVLLICMAFLALFARGAESQFVVHNRMPKFEVVNRCHAEKKAEYKAVRTLTVRAPVGHTHTCRNGHTWDHQANPTHTCQFCGASQYVVDPAPRMVTVQKVVQVPVAQDASKVVEPAQKYDHVSAYQSLFSFQGASSGGCANGQCPTASRSGLLRLR